MYPYHESYQVNPPAEREDRIACESQALKALHDEPSYATHSEAKQQMIMPNWNEAPPGLHGRSFRGSRRHNHVAWSSHIVPTYPVPRSQSPD